MKYNERVAKKVIETFDAAGANVKETCRVHGIARKTFYDWKDTYADFKEAIEEVKEGVIDNVESAHYKSALEGNVTAQIFILKTKGRERGYIERQEFDHTGLPSIEVIHTHKPNEEG